jgi:hypothetical protein
MALDHILHDGPDLFMGINVGKPSGFLKILPHFSPLFSTTLSVIEPNSP